MNPDPNPTGTVFDLKLPQTPLQLIEQFHADVEPGRTGDGGAG